NYRSRPDCLCSLLLPAQKLRVHRTQMHHARPGISRLYHALKRLNAEKDFGAQGSQIEKQGETPKWLQASVGHAEHAGSQAMVGMSQKHLSRCMLRGAEAAHDHGLAQSKGKFFDLSAVSVREVPSFQDVVQRRLALLKDRNLALVQRIRHGCQGEIAPWAQEKDPAGVL